MVFFDTLIEAMKEYPCLWQSYHKDYNNQHILDKSWLEVTKKQIDGAEPPFGILREVLTQQTMWWTLVSKYYATPLYTTAPKTEWFSKMQFITGPASDQMFITYGGMMEVLRRAGQYEQQTKRKIVHDEDLPHTMDKELKFLQNEIKEFHREEASVKPKKGKLENAILVDFIRRNWCLWEPNSTDYNNKATCEVAWKTIAKMLSGSEDEYYVSKYQRIWQGIMHRYLVQFTERKELCEQFKLIQQFMPNPKWSPEEQLSFVKLVLERSIEFVEITKKKFAMEKKMIYELRPDVIKGYKKRIEIPKEKKSEESENARYFAAMQELLKKR